MKSYNLLLILNNQTKKIISLTVLSLLLFSCDYFNSISSNRALNYIIEIAFKAHAEIIDVSNFNSFDWDQLLILGPYTVIETSEKTLQINLENIRKHAITHDDSINLFVFIKNGKSVKIAEVSRGVGDFKDLNILIEKNDAKFIKTTNGQIKLMY